MHLLHAGVASTEENEFESRKSEWPTEVRIGSSPIAHLFYFEYNFSLLDLSSFKILFPNFFKGITLSELNESFDFKNIDVCDAIKCLIYSKTLQNSIILSKNQLINDCFPCNVLTKIYVKNTAKNDLKSTLIEIAKKFKIEVEEY